MFLPLIISFFVLCSTNVMNGFSFVPYSSLKKGIAEVSEYQVPSNSDAVNWIGRSFYSSEDETTWFSFSLSGFSFESNCTNASIKVSYHTADPERWPPSIFVIIDNDYESVRHIELNEETGTDIVIHLAENIKKENHTFTILKKSEAGYTEIGLKSIFSDGPLAKPSIKDKTSIMFVSDHLGLGDYTELYNDSYTPISSFTTNPMNSFWFLCSRQLDANYCFVGARNFSVYQSKYIDKSFEISTFQDLFDASNFYVSTNNSNKQLWNHSNYKPDVVVLNIGFADHSFYTDLKQVDRKDFLIHFEESCNALIKSINENYPDTKILLMNGMVNIEKDLIDVFDNIATNNPLVFRFVSKSRTVREDMMYNMPTKNMHLFAAKELANELTNIINGKTSSRFDTYSIISVVSVLLIGVFIPIFYLLIDKKIRGNKS